MWSHTGTQVLEALTRAGYPSDGCMEYSHHSGIIYTCSVPLYTCIAPYIVMHIYVSIFFGDTHCSHTYMQTWITLTMIQKAPQRIVFWCTCGFLTAFLLPMLISVVQRFPTRVAFGGAPVGTMVSSCHSLHHIRWRPSVAESSKRRDGSMKSPANWMKNHGESYHQLE